MATCRLCGCYSKQPSSYCERCALSIFQVTETLELYLKENPTPEWLVGGISELGSVFTENPRTQSYLNTAREVTWMFTLDKLEEVSTDDILEVNYAQIPRDDILSVLEDAHMIERRNNKVFPGALVRKLREVRLEGFQMNTPEIASKLLEIQGILAIALINSLVKRQKYVPKRALAVLHLLSQNMIRSGENIEHIIPFEVFEMATTGLTSRQTKRVQYILSGFVDGQTRVISDVTDEGLCLKEATITYCEKMRQRWRDRERERDR